MHYSIHYHGSWGIVGAYANDVKETRYERREDGSTEGFAYIEQLSASILSPSSTTTVLPLNSGIHKMKAVEDSQEGLPPATQKNEFWRSKQPRV